MNELCPANLDEEGKSLWEQFSWTDTVIIVEMIDVAIESLTKEPVYQESLTVDLAKMLACKVTLVGRHGRFLTTTTEG